MVPGQSEPKVAICSILSGGEKEKQGRMGVVNLLSVSLLMLVQCGKRM